MTLYIFMLLLLIIGTIVEFRWPDSKMVKFFFWVSIVLLTAMMVFRYGQGADYWGYRTLYADAPLKRGFPLFWYTRELHTELGFRFLINLFTAAGIPHFYFFTLWSLVMVAFITTAIIKYSPYRMLSLLLLYPTVGLTYLFSGIRVGMVLSILFLFGLAAIKQQKWVKLAILVVVCSFIHMSSLLFLITIPFMSVPAKKIVRLVPIAVVTGLAVTYTPIHIVIANSFGGHFERLRTLEISWMGLAERTLMFGLISALFFLQKEEDILAKRLYNIYVLGYCIAWGGMVSAYLSQRLSVPFKAMELFLIPLLIHNQCKEIIRAVVTFMLIGVSSIMTLKNLNAYFDDKNAFQYHYIGIWDEKNDYLENWILDVTRWAENTYNENP